MKTKGERCWFQFKHLSTSFLLWSLISGCSNSFRTTTTSTTSRRGCCLGSGQCSPGTIDHHHVVTRSRSSPSLLSSGKNSAEEMSMTMQERFSVAPMMGHTHRHYHVFFSHISQYATLYTEMIPATQVVTAFQQQFSSVINKGVNTPTLEQVVDLLASQEFNACPSSSLRRPLDSLLQMANLPLSPSKKNGIKQPIVLQLGGSDPQQLALASAIGAHYGYDSLNLNCGCPSNAITSQGEKRSGGAALMRMPSVAASCVEAMSHAIDYYYYSTTAATRRKPTLSVKHRLGVHETATYDATADRARSDGDYQAFLQCRDFVRAISLGGEISKVQVHARLGLLGDYDPDSSSSRTESLWVPGTVTASTAGEKNKVDHKRFQYQAKKRARQVTIQNRSVPPLRPKVVDAIAAEFPHLHVITNGGIRSMKDIENRVPRSGSLIHGVMVGRAAINHPCAFGNVDALWDDISSDDGKLHKAKPTREAVLLDYMEYCKKEEETFIATIENSHHHHEAESVLGTLASFRRRLVAVPFHLFAGEDGNEEYQRRLRKLARIGRHSSLSILTAALAGIPAETALKPVNEYSKEIEDIPTFEAWTKRAGPLQRTIS